MVIYKSRNGFLVLAVAFLSLGCNCIDGSGIIEEKTSAVGDFTKVSLDVAGNLHVAQGQLEPVRVVTDDNIMEKLRVRVVDDQLRIEPDCSSCCLDPTEMDVYVSAPTYERLSLKGAGAIQLTTDLTVEGISFAIEGSGNIQTMQVEAPVITASIEGSGDIDMELTTDSLTTNIEGSGSAHLVGTAMEHTIQIEGSGSIGSFGLETEHTTIHVEGSGTCEVYAASTLTVSIEGVGYVYYEGSPEVTQSIQGVGSVEPVS